MSGESPEKSFWQAVHSKLIPGLALVGTTAGATWLGWQTVSQWSDDQFRGSGERFNAKDARDLEDKVNTRIDGALARIVMDIQEPLNEIKSELKAFREDESEMKNDITEIKTTVEMMRNAR